MTRIIEKDISWLHERVPDFHTVVTEFAHVFSNGGYLAGGALRAFVLNGGVEKSYGEDRSNSVVWIDREPKLFGDIDFFFYTQLSCRKVVDAHFKMYTSRRAPATPNSHAGFAFEVNHKSLCRSVNKHQFIYSNYGKPFNIIDGFDIANCKIATDGKKVWMVEDWEELEKNKLFRIDNPNAKFLSTRIKKYLDRNKDYNLDEDSKEQLLYSLIKNSDKIPSIVKSFIKLPIFEPKLVLMFYGKLGYFTKLKDKEDYSQGIISREDYAVHVYNERTAQA